MIAVLSPAKNLNESCPSIPGSATPRHLEKTDQLVNKLSKFSKPKLMELMSISPQLASLNQARYQSFDIDHSAKNSLPALYMFNGDAYRGLSAQELEASTVDYAKSHLRILSGLYGLLRPHDLIQPYRLEMGTRLSIRRKKDLYGFWGDDLTKTLNEDVKSSGSSHIINLASNEYWSAIDESKLDVPVIKVNFREWRKGQYRFLSFNAKRARGLMTKYILEEQINDIEGLKGFLEEDYHYNEELSDEKTVIFTRE